MKRTMNGLVVALFALSSFSAQAAHIGTSFGNPTENGGCGAVLFEDVQNVGSYVDFYVPELADGERVEVQGVAIGPTGSYSIPFTCNQGVISNDGQTGDWYAI